MSWFGFERRWRDAIFAALYPSTARRPGLDRGSLEPFFAAFLQAAPPLVALGLRASVWLVALLPPLLLVRPCSFAGLSAERRDALLARAAASDAYLLRQVLATLKLVGGLALAADPDARAALLARRGALRVAA